MAKKIADGNGMVLRPSCTNSGCMLCSPISYHSFIIYITFSQLTLLSVHYSSCARYLILYLWFSYRYECNLNFTNSLEITEYMPAAIHLLLSTINFPWGMAAEWHTGTSLEQIYSTVAPYYL